ncbi:MAG TPA: OsmC family protein [Candidatus Kryptonia bacterium]
MKIVLKQVEGNAYVGKGESNHWVPVDTSPSEGGSGAGTGPMELVLIALAGCTAIDVELILKKKRSGMKRLEVEVSGERAKNPPRVFTNIHVKYIIHGEVKRADAEHAVSLSQDKYCSVAGTLRHAVSMTHEIEIVE